MADVRAETGEVPTDGEIPLGGGKKTLGLVARLGNPEDLGEAHGLLVVLVAEDADDHGIAVAVAQRDGAGHAGVAAFRLVVAENIGSQHAFAVLRPRSLVIGNAVRRHQERSHGIHQGRFAGADVSGHETIPTTELQRPDALVECAPIEHLEAMQAVTGKRVVRDAVED